jgi:hypothetical protein
VDIGAIATNADSWFRGELPNGIVFTGVRLSALPPRERLEFSNQVQLPFFQPVQIETKRFHDRHPSETK